MLESVVGFLDRGRSKGRAFVGAPEGRFETAGRREEKAIDPTEGLAEARRMRCDVDGGVFLVHLTLSHASASLLSRVSSVTTAAYIGMGASHLSSLAECGRRRTLSVPAEAPAAGPVLDVRGQYRGPSYSSNGDELGARRISVTVYDGLI